MRLGLGDFAPTGTPGLQVSPNPVLLAFGIMPGQLTLPPPPAPPVNVGLGCAAAYPDQNVCWWRADQFDPWAQRGRDVLWQNIGLNGCVAIAAQTSTPNTTTSGATTKYTDAQVVAGANTMQYTGATDFPGAQLARISSSIAISSAVNPGTVLAYMLGLGGAAAAGTTMPGSDGNTYQMQNGRWVTPPCAGTWTDDGTSGLGDFVSAMFPVPQNPIVKGLAGVFQGNSLGRSFAGMRGLDTSSMAAFVASAQSGTSFGLPNLLLLGGGAIALFLLVGGSGRRR